MKRSDLFGLTFYVTTLVALELVARDRRPWWWGWLLVASWVTCLVAIIGGRHANWFGDKR